MKAIVTLILILFIGLAVRAQSENTKVKVVTITQGIVAHTHLNTAIKNEGKVVRLYLFKNSRVKKELSFTTKSDRPKLV